MKKLSFIIFFSVFSSVVRGQSVEEYLAMTDSLLREDQFEVVYQRLLKLDSMLAPSEDELLLMKKEKLKGDYYLSHQQYPAAIEAYESFKAYNRPLKKEDALQMARALNDLGIAYYETGAFDSAQSAHERSLKLYEKYDDKQGLAYNYSNLGNLAKERKHYKQAIGYYDKSKAAALAIGDTIGVGFNCLQMAVLSADSKDRVKAIDNYLQAIEVFNSMGHEVMEANSRRMLGEFYQNLDDFHSAKPLLTEARQFFERIDKPKTVGRIYTDFVKIHKAQGQLDSARYYAGKALELFEPIEHKKGLATVYILLGDISYKEGKYEESMRFYKNGLEITNGALLGEEIPILLGMAQIHLVRKEYYKAVTLAELALKKTNGNSNFVDLGIHEALYKAHKALGHYEKALKNHEQFLNLQDSMYSKTQALEIARIEYREYLRQKEVAQKAEQERQQLIYEQEMARQQWMQYSAFGLLFFVSLLFVSYYRSFQIKKKDNYLLAEKNEIIEANNVVLTKMNDELHRLRERDLERQQRELQLLEESIELKERELAATTMITHEKNSILTTLDQKLTEISTKMDLSLKKEIKELRKTISANLNLGDSWDSFLHQFENVHPKFFEQLKEIYPNLTVNELKLCAYIKVGMGNKEIAQVTNVAVATVKKSINRLKKKLELSAEESIRDFMMSEQFWGKQEI